MGSNASTGGGGGGVGPAGLITNKKTGETKYGEVKDAKKTSGRNELRTFIRDGGIGGAIIKGITGKTPYERNLERRQKFVKKKGLNFVEKFKFIEYIKLHSFSQKLCIFVHQYRFRLDYVGKAQGHGQTFH